MKRLLVIPFYFMLFHFCDAQKAVMNKGYLTYSIGADTTMIGYYQVEGDNVKFKVMGRLGLSVTLAEGSLYSNGELKQMRGYSYPPQPDGKVVKLIEFDLYHKNDTTFIDYVRDGIKRLVKYPGRGMVANIIGTPFLFQLAVLIKYAPREVGKVIESNHFVLGKGRKFTIKKISIELLEMGSDVMGYFKLHLNDQGGLKSIDGMGTSWNVTGSVKDSINLDDYISTFIAKESTAPLKPLAMKDSVLANFDGKTIRIDYSRPSKRGRMIFGNVVPWNRIWRTGANEPTKLTTSSSLYFNGKELKAGTYSIFTLPSPGGWTLIINSKTDMWGTDHDPAYDIMKIPIQTRPIPVKEVMTIVVSKEKTHPLLGISWDELEAFVFFDTEKK